MISQRNGEIAKNVLKGYTIMQVGNIYGLSPERIRQITVRTCRKIDSGMLTGIYGLKGLRKRKNYYIAMVEDSNIEVLKENA